MLVVSDTTAITTLLKAGMVDLLPALFERVFIPQAVWNELLAFHSELPEFLVLNPVESEGELLPETSALGRGEAESITLAKGIPADLLLTDDSKARQIARRLDIRCTGLLGLLIRGKKRGFVPSVREAITRLETQGGLYLSDAVKAEALKMAGEIE